MHPNDKNKNSMEKELREIIGWNCGGTYEAKVEAVKQILVLFNVSGSFTDGYNKGFKDGLDHRTLKCKCGKK